MRGDQIHSLINLVEQGLLFLDHAPLHFTTEVLRRSLGNLLDVAFPDLRSLGKLTVRSCDVRAKDLFVELRRRHDALSDRLQQLLPTVNHLLPEPLAVVADCKHDELLVHELLTLPVLLEGRHVKVRHPPLPQLAFKLGYVVRTDLLIRGHLLLVGGAGLALLLVLALLLLLMFLRGHHLFFDRFAKADWCRWHGRALADRNPRQVDDGQLLAFHIVLDRVDFVCQTLVRKATGVEHVPNVLVFELVDRAVKLVEQFVAGNSRLAKWVK